MMTVVLCLILLSNGTVHAYFVSPIDTLAILRGLTRWIMSWEADNRWFSGHGFTAWAEYRAPFRNEQGANVFPRYTPTEYYPVEQDAQYRLGNQPPFVTPLGPVPFTFHGAAVEMDEGGNGIGGSCDTKFNILYAYTGWADDIIRDPQSQPATSGQVSYHHAWLKGYLTRHVVEVTPAEQVDVCDRIAFEDYVYRYRYHAPDGSVIQFYQRPGESATRSSWTLGPCNQRVEVIPPEPTLYWSDDESAMLDTSNDKPTIRWSDGSLEEFHCPTTVEYPLSVINSGGPRWFNRTSCNNSLDDLKIRDRNGNLTRFTYTSTTESMIDNRGRETKATFQDSPNTLGFVRLLSVEVPAPGAGAPLKYEVNWRNTPLSINFASIWPDVICHGANGAVAPCGASNVDVVDSIKVPDGRSYTFTYTPWGGLASVTEPSGALHTYTYGDATNTTYATNTLPLVNSIQRALPCGDLWSGEMRKVQARGVKAASIFPLGAGDTPETMSFSYERVELSGCNTDTIGAAKAGPDACTQVWKVITYPDGSKKRIGNATRALNFFVKRPPVDSGPLSPHGWEIGTEVLNSSNVLISANYTGNKDTGELFYQFEIIPTIRMNAKAVGDRRTTKVKTSKDGVAAATTYVYGDQIDIDTSNATVLRNTANVTRKCVWSGNAVDCDSGTGTKLVETTTTYHHPSDYLSRNLLHLPARETLIDPLRGIIKRTDYGYDETPLAPSNAPPSVLDTSISDKRGNVTTTTFFADAEVGTGGVTTRNFYLDNGAVSEARDANDNPMTMTYDFALCSASHKVVTNTARNAKQHLTTTLEDCATGLVLKVTDPNNQSTFSQYDHLGRSVEVAGPGDPLTALPAIVAGSSPPAGQFRYLRDPNIPSGRLKAGSVVGNLGNGPTSWTEYLDLGSVTPVFRQRVVNHIKDGTANGLYTKTFTDGLGRTRQVRKEGDVDKAGGAEIVETTIYDTMGRISQAFVAYGAAAADVYEAPPASAKFTLNEYDALGRLTGSTPPGLPKITTRYEKNPSANEYLVTLIDSKGNTTQTFSDVLDRALRVARSAPVATCASGWCVRTMEYDAAGRLLRVLEADNSVQITYIYDDIGRKKEMTDLDMGRWTYNYDNNGNLTSQTDAKGQTINIEYDVLNRIKRKDLPPLAPSAGPEDTTYFYDGETAP